jgi:hypothetical protein
MNVNLSEEDKPAEMNAQAGQGKELHTYRKAAKSSGKRKARHRRAAQRAERR